MTHFNFKLCHMALSTCSLAKNLLRALMLRAGSDPPELHGDRDHQPPSEDILGRCYERRTRVRRPIESHPLKQREGGIYAIYSTLTCPELEEPAEVLSVASYHLLLYPIHISIRYVLHLVQGTSVEGLGMARGRGSQSLWSGRGLQHVTTPLTQRPASYRMCGGVQRGSLLRPDRTVLMR